MTNPNISGFFLGVRAEINGSRLYFMHAGGPEDRFTSEVFGRLNEGVLNRCSEFSSNETDQVYENGVLICSITCDRKREQECMLTDFDGNEFGEWVIERAVTLGNQSGPVKG